MGSIGFPVRTVAGRCMGGLDPIRLFVERGECAHHGLLGDVMRG